MGLAGVFQALASFVKKFGFYCKVQTEPVRVKQGIASCPSQAALCEEQVGGLQGLGKG
jgi:hypothetical protein